MPFIPGYSTVLSIASTNVDGSDLTVGIEVEELDYTNFNSGGYQEVGRGIMKMTASGTIEVDSSALPVVAVGTAVVISGTFGALGPLSASCLITSAQAKGAVRGKVTLDFAASSTGAITRPSQLGG